MHRVLKTNEFNSWICSLSQKSRAVLESRMDFLAIGHLGDHKYFDGLIELRWKNGRRVYCFKWNSTTLVVLYGGNKSGQSKEIKKAKKIRQEVLGGTCPVFE